MKRFSNSIPAIIAAVALFVAAFAPVSAALPIPAAGSPSVPTANTINAALFTNQALIASQSSDSVQIGEFNACGLQFATVQGSPVNTITVAFQGSNNQSAWITYTASAASAANVLTSSVVATSDFYVFYVPPAKYARLNVTLANTQPVTFTGRLFCK